MGEKEKKVERNTGRAEGGWCCMDLDCLGISAPYHRGLSKVTPSYLFGFLRPHLFHHLLIILYHDYACDDHDDDSENYDDNHNDDVNDVVG